MRRKTDLGYEDKEIFSPWETFSDLYCGLLLVFVLLFFFAIYQYVDAREKNNADTAALQESLIEEQTSVLAIYKADLEDQAAAYQEKNEELNTQKTALTIMQADLEERMEQLREQESLIEEQEEQLKSQQKKLVEQQELLDAQQITLNEQQTILSEQKITLNEQQITLNEQQEMLNIQAEQIEQVVGVRGKLIDALNKELAVNQIQIQADHMTGAIVFESTILFGRDSNELSVEGQEFFRRFIPVYLDVLLRPGFREYLAEIIVEGHTDNTGSYIHNLELSQKRAGSVAEYILRDDCDFLDSETIASLKTFITVNGCADKAPVYMEDGSIDADKSRRVEIKFRLKDQEMIQEMDDILNCNQERTGE